MLRTFACILIVITSCVVVAGQTPDGKKEDAAKSQQTTSRVPIEPQRSVGFTGGISLQFLIKELASDLDLNVLFDTHSRLETRRASVELTNVSSAEALKYLLAQEDLISEEIGPRTILIANRSRAASLPLLGTELTPLTDQLSRYFGVDGGTLISNVRPDSPAAKAGLKAGDVITEIDGTPVRGTLGLHEAVRKKKESDFTLRIVRDRKALTITVSKRGHS